MDLVALGFIKYSTASGGRNYFLNMLDTQLADSCIVQYNYLFILVNVHDPPTLKSKKNNHTGLTDWN